MNKSFPKKLLTFQYNSDIINNVKRNRQALYISPPFLHIERLTGSACGTLLTGSTPVLSIRRWTLSEQKTQKEAKDMARKRMVTRTIIFTTATATVYDIQTDEIKTLEYNLSGELSADEALKAITKDHKEVRPLKVTDISVQEELYGMPEEKFLELAEILPTRTAKANIAEDPFGNVLA